MSASKPNTNKSSPGAAKKTKTSGKKPGCGQNAGGRS
jgi:hypothetical protein